MLIATLALAVGLGGPANDDCLNAIALTGAGVTAYDSTLATTDGVADPLCLFFSNDQIDNDVWYAWTADSDGDYTFSLCGSSYDTKMALYSDFTCPTGAAVFCNDDDCGLQSSLAVPGVLNGDTFLIRAGSFPGGAGGAGSLDISFVAPSHGNDDCASATPISGLGSFAFDNSLATTSGIDDPLCDFFTFTTIDTDCWWAWTPDADGDYTIDTCGSAIDTKMAVYDGDTCGTSLVMLCNDDSCGLQSSVVFNGAIGGTTYLIAVGNFPGESTGAGVLNISGGPVPPANDDCANAEAIAGEGTFAFDNTVATTDGTDDPLCLFFASEAIDNDVWFAWTADATANYRIETCGSTGDTKIAAYDSTVCPTGAPVACNDDDCSLQSGFTLAAAPGQTFLTRVGAFPGAAGNVGALTIVKESAAIIYCTQTVNSTGLAGAISTTGTASIIADDLGLVADNIPAGQFGLWVMSDTKDNVAFFNGIRCVGNPFVRISNVVPTGGVPSDPAQQVTLAINNTVAPTIFLPGDTKNMQFWFRDHFTGNNTTDAAAVTFGL